MSERVQSLLSDGASAVEGRVVWDPLHSLWNSAMLAGAVAAFFFGSWPGVLIFALSTAAGLLLGHSVGFHRRMIHGSFDCPLWLERTLAWFGTSVGMSGPFWMIRTHDMR